MTRRLHQCHKDGCDSEARWSVALRFLCPESTSIISLRKAHRLHCQSTIKVCDRHRQDAAEYLVSERNWAALCRLLLAENFPKPDLHTVTIEFERIDHDKVEAEAA